jgi:hypothetical protein
MLLVPNEIKDELVEQLTEVRNNLDHHAPIGIKNVKKNKGKVFDCAQSWIAIGCAALRSQTKSESYPVYLGKREKGKKTYQTLNSPIGCKLIIFREVSNHQNFDYYGDYGRKVETSFRVGLKGGLHFLGDQKNKIHISELRFDGHEHYGRNIDPSRVVGRLNGLRDYCQVSSVIHDGTSNHTKEDSQPYEDCQLLQLADLFVGSFRSCIHQTRDCHSELCEQPRQLLDSYQMGYARMKHSRWKGSLSISQCSLDENGWSFSSIEYTKANSNQLELI